MPTDSVTIFKTRDMREALRTALVVYDSVILVTRGNFAAASETVYGIPSIRAQGPISRKMWDRWRREGGVLCAPSPKELCECVAFREVPISTTFFDNMRVNATKAVVLPLPPTWRYHELKAENAAPPGALVENLALAIMSTPEDSRVLHCALALDQPPAGLTVCDATEVAKAARMSPQALQGAIESLRKSGWVAYYKRLLLLRVIGDLRKSKWVRSPLVPRIENAYEMNGVKMLPVDGADDVWGVSALVHTGYLTRHGTLLVFGPRSSLPPSREVTEGRHRWHRQMFETMRQTVEEAPWMP